jgi:hypothetical protein
MSGRGGANSIVDHTNEQQRALEQRRAEVTARRQAEIDVARRLEEQEERGVELERTYSSLQQEVEVKTRKLRKLFAKLQTIKQDIVDVTEEYNRQCCGSGIFWRIRIRNWALSPNRNPRKSEQFDHFDLKMVLVVKIIYRYLLKLFLETLFKVLLRSWVER